MLVFTHSKLVSAFSASISHDYQTSFLPCAVKSSLVYTQKCAWKRERPAGEEKSMFYNLTSCDFTVKTLGLKGRVFLILLKAAWMAAAKKCDISALHTSVSAMGPTVLFFSLPALELLRLSGWKGLLPCAGTKVEPQSWLEVPQHTCLTKESCKDRLVLQASTALSPPPYLTLHLTTPGKSGLFSGTWISFPAYSREMKTEVFFDKCLYVEYLKKMSRFRNRRSAFPPA